MKVIVIGGGIVGASAAYHLCRAGVPTTLVDSARRGRATDAGAGVVFPWPMPGASPADTAFALQAAADYPGLMADLDSDGHPTGYRAVGGMAVAGDPAAADRDLELLRALSAEPGYEGIGAVRRLAEGEPAEHIPVLDPSLSGVAVPGMARISGRQVRDALIAAAEERGLRTVAGDAEITASGHRATGVRAGGAELPADAVIVAAGAWSAALLRPFGIDLPVYPMRGQIVHARLPRERTGEWPVVRFSGTGRYLLGAPPDRVVLSATREPWAGFDHRATVGGILQVLADAVETAPALTDAELSATRIGFRPASRDGVQLLGAPRTLDGVTVATGLGANGLTFGPHQGAVAARLALGEDTGLDLEPFRPDRVAPAPGTPPGGTPAAQSGHTRRTE